MKKLFIRTYGCQMNVYDSNRMVDLLKPHGYEVTEQVEDANLVVINTCNIREKAAEKLYSELGKMKLHKDAKRVAGEPMNIVVSGCVGQAEGEEVFARAPFVDVVVGPQSYYKLPELIRQVHAGDKHRIDLNFPLEEKFDLLPEVQTTEGYSSFLSVQEGCDKFCTFCCVPYTRGAEFSRPAADIYREALQLVSKGASDITLLGQNVNAYHGKGPEGEQINLATLIRHLAALPKLKRIRYTTSHPRDMDDSLIKAHGNNPKLMPYLHLPVQSGSDKILKAMNRKHTANDYLKIIHKLRNERPDIALSSDFIVGFPGETDEDFAATMKLVEEVKFAQAFSFKYSPRPGTPAAVMEKQVPEDVKSLRLAQLQALLLAQQDEFNQNSVGKVMEVLLEKPGRYPGQLVGKTPYLQTVHVVAPSSLLGEMVVVEILELQGNTLAAKLLGTSEDSNNHFALASGAL